MYFVNPQLYVNLVINLALTLYPFSHVTIQKSYVIVQPSVCRTLLRCHSTHPVTVSQSGVNTHRSRLCPRVSTLICSRSCPRPEQCLHTAFQSTHHSVRVPALYTAKFYRSSQHHRASVPTRIVHSVPERSNVCSSPATTFRNTFGSLSRSRSQQRVEEESGEEARREEEDGVPVTSEDRQLYATESCTGARVVRSIVFIVTRSFILYCGEFSTVVVEQQCSCFLVCVGTWRVQPTSPQKS